MAARKADGGGVGADWAEGNDPASPRASQDHDEARTAPVVGTAEQADGLRFRKQHPAGCYILDFYCDSAKLCVEVDGETHDFTASRDAARDRWLAARGVRTLRISSHEVLNNLDGVVQYILDQSDAPSGPLRGPPPPRGEGL